MNTVSVTLDTLINRTILDVAQPGEQGLQVVMGSTALTATTSTTMTLTSATGVNVSDVIEFGNELVLVTAKTTDATPVFTVSRGYYMSTAQAHAAGDVGHVNPPYPRAKVAEGIRRAFSRMEALDVPLITSGTFNQETDKSYIQLPANCRDVVGVIYWGADGRWWDLEHWKFHDSIPTSQVSTGKVLNIGRYVANADDIEVIYRIPYRWSTHPSDPDGDATITIPEGAEDLPPLYASAWILSGRELSRSELDRSEEWQRTDGQSRDSANARVRTRWQEFYRALDEARRLNPLRRPIIYKPKGRF